VKKLKSEVQKTISLDGTVACSQAFRTGRATGKIWRMVKYLREKVFPKNPRFSRGKRAFALAAFEKTFEFSLVMFWKKSPTREKHRENGYFRHPPFSAAAKKVGQVS
jgi:hypothetical protein